MSREEKIPVENVLPFNFVLASQDFAQTTETSSTMME
jgi:hypothetical protein